MQARTVSIIEIFNSRMQLEIPRFQRQYVWSEKIQWLPLWEDLERKFNEFLLGKTDAPPHFLGAVVLDQQRTATGTVERRSVIDGQQRLTTFQLLLLAMRNYAKAVGAIGLSYQIDCVLINMNAEGEEKFKISPTINDLSVFLALASAQTHADIAEANPVVKRARARKPEPRHRMVDAYFFFYEKISTYVTDVLADEEMPLAPRTAENIVSVLYDALRNGLKIVSIDLDKNDDPQVIFETLNARGEPLLPADLLRNFISLRAARNNEDPDRIYNELWKELELPFWKTESNQGRSLRPRSDLFIQHYLASQTGQDVSIKHLYVEYKHWSTKEASFPNIYSEVSHLIKHALVFKGFWEEQSEYAWFGELVSTFEVSTCLPLAIRVVREAPTEAAEILRLVESYIVRRSICGLTPKNFNKVFTGAVRACKESGTTGDTIRKYFAGLKGETVVFPSDEMLETKWKQINAYLALGSGKVAHIMKSINANLLGIKSEQVQFSFSPSIEHILPQSWEENWPLPNGERGYGRHEYEKLNQGDETANLSQTRHQLIHSFGNLTLVTTPLNSSLSNLPWERKRLELLKHSVLPINTRLALTDKWDEDSISARTLELFERAVAIWPTAIN